jgi:hypothetical protein
MKCPLAVGPHLNTLTRHQRAYKSFNCTIEAPDIEGIVSGPPEDCLWARVIADIATGEELVTSYGDDSLVQNHQTSFDPATATSSEATFASVPAPPKGRRKSKRRRRGKHRSQQTSDNPTDTPKRVRTHPPPILAMFARSSTESHPSLNPPSPNLTGKEFSSDEMKNAVRPVFLTSHPHHPPTPRILAARRAGRGVASRLSAGLTTSLRARIHTAARLGLCLGCNPPARNTRSQINNPAVMHLLPGMLRMHHIVIPIIPIPIHIPVPDPAPLPPIVSESFPSTESIPSPNPPSPILAGKEFSSDEMGDAVRPPKKKKSQKI